MTKSFIDDHEKENDIGGKFNMRKKALGIAAVAAAMTLSTGITAFAAGWVTESTPYGDKQKYVYDNGNWPSGNWFTDPDTQLVYHLDPDGYRMTDTTVDGYWLNSEGVRQEKSQEDIDRENREAAKKASKPNPGKTVAAAKVAASEAKDKNAAVSTTRRSYISELKVIINKITKTLAAARTDNSVQILTTEDNLEVSRTFHDSNSGDFYKFSMWNSAKDKANTVDLVYVYDAAPEADRNLYNTAYEQSVVAALGDTEGKAVTDYVQSQRELGITDLTREGKTDSGNSYSLTYKNNKIQISVTCSEVTENDQTEEASTETAATEEAAPVVTSKTITVGAATATAEENTEAAAE